MQKIFLIGLLQLSFGAGCVLFAVEKKIKVQNGEIEILGEKIPVYGKAEEVTVTYNDGDGARSLQVEYYFPGKSTEKVLKDVAAFYTGKSIFGTKVGKFKKNKSNGGAYNFENCSKKPELLIVIYANETPGHVYIGDMCLP
jgi:hypothetical protein